MIIYNINKAKRTIVAMYEDGGVDVYASLANMLEGFMDMESSVGLYFRVTDLLDKYVEQGRMEMVGIAKCHEDDVWDEEKGKELAKKRLNRKFEILKNDVLRNVLKRAHNVFVNVQKRMYAKYKGTKSTDVRVEYRQFEVTPATVTYDPVTKDIVGDYPEE